MKKFTLMLAAALMGWLPTTVATAEEVTVEWEITPQSGYNTADKVEEVVLAEGYTATFGAGVNTTGAVPKYYENGNSIRVYKNNAIVFAGENITKIAITYVSGYEGGISAEPEGTIVQDTEAQAWVWAGLANEVTVTATANIRVTKLAVTYSTGAVEEKDEPVAAPEGLQTTDYLFRSAEVTGTDDEGTVYTEVYSAPLKVGFDGAEVYVQGLCRWLPESWAKGTLADGQLTIASGLYFGANEDDYPFYLTTADGSAEIIFSYDEASGRFTGAAGQLLVFGEKKTYDAATDYPYAVYSENLLVKVVPAVPATPSVYDFGAYSEEFGYGYVVLDIPLEDTEGNPIDASRLAYRLLVDEEKVVSGYVFDHTLYGSLDEDLTEVPYDYDDWGDFTAGGTFISLYKPTDSYNKIGVQTVYTVGEEVNASEISWYDIKDYAPDTTGIRSVKAAATTDDAVYTLQGVRVSAPQRGIYIQNGKKILK